MAMTRTILSMALAAAFAASPAVVSATPKHCPPGHAKKGWCKPGERYYAPNDYRRVDDWRRYELQPPPHGHVYAVVDGEVLLILEATREVLEAIGAVDRVLRN